MAPTRVHVTGRDFQVCLAAEMRVMSRLPTPGPCAALLTQPPAALRVYLADSVRGTITWQEKIPCPQHKRDPAQQRQASLE